MTSISQETSTSTPPQKKPSSAFQMVWDWLACFRSIKLAIVLLSLLAIGVMVGVFLPQEGLVDIGQIKRTYGENYRMMKAMGLFNVYSSAWFIAIEVLFFFNLLFGSFQWLKPAFMSATQRLFMSAKQMAKAKEHALFVSPHDPETTAMQIKQVLKRRRFGVYFKQKAEAQSNSEAAIYATKGNLSRFGPVVAHLGILLMLVFSVYGAFTGFKAQKLATPGSQFNLMESEYFMPNVNSGIWQGDVPNWTFKVEDFRIEFYPNNPETIKQYFCKLKILAPSGKTLAEKTISVNDPLTYKDLTVYQASYSPTGKLFLEVNGRPITFEVNADFNGRPISVTPLTQDIALVIFPFFVQQDPGVKNNHITVFLQKDNRFVGTPGQMPPNLKLNMGETGEFAGLRIRYVRPEYATGLQIKQAPEVPYMYLSFGIIMLGTLMCIFSQRMLWAGLAPLPKGQGTAVYLLHKTNKAKASYMKELSAIEQELLTLWPKQDLISENDLNPESSAKPENSTNKTFDPNQEPALR
jgi:cytochrome c biogenesis protein